MKYWRLECYCYRGSRYIKRNNFTKLLRNALLTGVAGENDNKKIIHDGELIENLEIDDSDIIITLGAGDISEKVESIKKLILQNVI